MCINTHRHNKQDDSYYNDYARVASGAATATSRSVVSKDVSGLWRDGNGYIHASG